jgi:hypothetical protein
MMNTRFARAVSLGAAARDIQGQDALAAERGGGVLAQEGSLAITDDPGGRIVGHEQAHRDLLHGAWQRLLPGGKPRVRAGG